MGWPPVRESYLAGDAKPNPPKPQRVVSGAHIPGVRPVDLVGDRGDDRLSPLAAIGTIAALVFACWIILAGAFETVVVVYRFFGQRWP